MYATIFYFWVQIIIVNCSLYLRIFLNLFFFLGQKTSVPFHVYQIFFLKVSLLFVGLFTCSTVTCQYIPKVITQEPTWRVVPLLKLPGEDPGELSWL